MNPVLRRRLLLVGGLLLTLWATWQVSQEPSTPAIVGSRSPWRSTARTPASVAVPALSLQWPERVPAQRAAADLFAATPASVAPASAPPPTARAEPAFRFKYIGHLVDGDHTQAFLTDEKDQVVTVKVGQAVDSEWQLVAMNETQLVFRHQPGGQEYTLQIGTFQ